MSAADIISIYAIAAIWSMMVLNVILSIGGYIYIYRCNKTDGHIPMAPEAYPMVSILVPAHNEALVLERTVKALLNFDYPEDKYEVIIINDNSTDNTVEIMSKLASVYPSKRLMCISTDNVVGGTGKSNALNIGFSIAKGSVIAIYDADNTPEKGALRLLVENLMADDKLGAVIGKFRTRNRNASILSRFVNIETLSHQCMNQAGRFFFFKLCTIPGTNYVIRRSMGYYIKLLPQAVTWEQEPHLLPIWFRQRVRWAKGNVYVMIKNFKYTFDRQAGAMRMDTVYYALIYSIMLTSLVASDFIFLGGMLGIIHVKLGGFSPALWGMAILVFVANVMLTLSLEKNEFNIESLGLVFLMLFTYAKLWVIVVVKAIWDSAMDAIFKREVKWDKTVRYVEEGDKK